MFLREMAPDDVRAAIASQKYLLIPAGCVEFHGNHLPLGVDTIIAEAVVTGVAAKIGGVVGPTIDYGPTGYVVTGPERGTVDIPPEAFYGYVKSVIAGLLRLGFPGTFVIVHHQGPDLPTSAAFHFAIASLLNELHETRGNGWWGAREPEPWPALAVLPTISSALREKVRADHAGRTETALLLHLRPDLVDLGRLVRGDFWYTWETGRESQTATARLGSEVLDLMVESVAEAIREQIGRPGPAT